MDKQIVDELMDAWMDRFSRSMVRWFYGDQIDGWQIYRLIDEWTDDEWMD